MTTDSRLEHFLANHRIRHELVRLQLEKVATSLRGKLATDLEIAERMLQGAARANATFTAIDAAFLYADLIARIYRSVLRGRPPSRKQRKTAAVKAFVLGHSAAGRTANEIIAMRLVPQSTVYRILKSKRIVRKVKGQPRRRIVVC